MGQVRWNNWQQFSRTKKVVSRTATLLFDNVCEAFALRFVDFRILGLFLGLGGYCWFVGILPCEPELSLISYFIQTRFFFMWITFCF